MIIKKPRSEGKIKSHFGIVNYYKYFKENNKESKIDKTLYNKIISDFNNEIINLIINENVEYYLPHIGSSLSIRKTKKLPSIVNGKLVNTAPVDWVITNKLWNEDEEAREKKLLVRFNNLHTSKFIFRVFFKKYYLSFLNKKYYSFKTSRGFQRLLAKRIKDEDKEQYDSYLLY